ncbi:hypothetical protein [Kribbella sindirgiensis]|uniref:LppX_LprAFG lipoprotein n=1 Tax=Kribbella sindirgiensis TaxID=1124744 RepID=A0A4R0J912_9ACTN|nr:hypothetical protein [Kribbella sindirgiensis]TCC43183.1 hypothetical protein E0H50_01470 [Kribbella sindirgiensis]
MKFRAAVATAAAVPLALGLAACGGEPKATGYKPSTPATTTAAPKPDVTNTAAPAKPATVTHLNRVTFVPAMTSAIAKQRSWHITGTMTANGAPMLTMDGYQTANPVAMSMEMTGAAFDGKTAKTIVIKNIAYVSMPGLTPAGKFVKFKSGLNNQLSELVEGGDPTKIYKSFGSSMIDAKFVGTEFVLGETLDRYDVTVNTAKALAAQGKKVPAGVPSTLTYSMFMDKAHLIRRLTFDLSGVSMVMDMTGYNRPVEITAPSASQIVSR